MSDYKQRVAKRKADEAAARRAAPRAYARPKPHVCDEDCEHYRSPLEQQISAEIAKVLKALVPAGARAVSGYEAADMRSPSYVRLVCNGSIPVMAYDCCMKPNHPGQCYSANKGVHFSPDPPSYETKV